MSAIAFDLDARETELEHPGGVSQAYRDIERTPESLRFPPRPGQCLFTEVENLANVTRAMNALRSLAWFPASVRDIRAFRAEQWSDFTAYIKEDSSNR